MRKSRGNLLFLTGGLGNQLFQLCFALSSTNDEIVLESRKGSPRISPTGLPDLLEFEIPKRVVLGRFKNSKFVAKTIGYNLRIGVVQRGLERSDIFRWFVKLVSTPIFSVHYKRLLTPLVAQGAGFDPRLLTSCKRKLIIGYFQSFIWLKDNSVFEEMNSIYLKSPSSAYSQMLKKIKEEPTIILHIRLGDYLQESGFGTPSVKFLENALNLIRTSSGGARIWGFSDEPDRARALTSYASLNDIYWVSPESLTSAETLEIMREGAAYVLANSTFSWWAASLRRNRAAQVIAPEPWFKNMDEPKLLIPPDWVRLEAF
jgi:hypothetical protein